MPPSGPILRQIIEQPGFHKRAALLFKTPQGADVALSGVTTLLSSHPDLRSFEYVDNTPLGAMHIYRTADTTAFRSVVVYFIIGDMDRVYLEDIRWATRVP